MSTEMNPGMSPADFRERLNEALGDVDLTVTTAELTAFERRGRTLLRRRRARVGVGAGVLAAGLVAGGLFVPVSTRAQPVATTTPATAPTSADEDLLAECRSGTQSARATRIMFAGGDPVVKAVGKTDSSIAVALEAVDGEHWAHCWLDADGDDYATGMAVYDSTGDDPNPHSWAAGYVDVDQSGSGFSITLVDRRPTEVAAVRFLTADGREPTVKTIDGYVAFSHDGEIPATAPESDPQAPDFLPIIRMTFLDSRNEPIAAAVLDGSGEGPEHDLVDGLPSITRFPSLRYGPSIP